MLITGDMKGFIGMIAERRATDYYRRLSRPPVSVSIDGDMATVILIYETRFSEWF